MAESVDSCKPIIIVPPPRSGSFEKEHIVSNTLLSILSEHCFASTFMCSSIVLRISIKWLALFIRDSTYSCLFLFLVGKAVGEVDVLSWVGHGVDYQGYAGYDEGDAEPLAHVECHVLLKGHLRILYELYEESR